MRFARKWMFGLLAVAAGLLPMVSVGATFAYQQILESYGSGVAGTNDPASEAQVIALGNDGQAYLPAWLDTGGTWHVNAHAQALLAGQTSSQTFKQLIAGTGLNWHYLVVFGLATDGTIWKVAYQDFSGTWHWNGTQLSSDSYSYIAAGNGSAGNLDVMGIGASDGKVYLVASQNGSGVWTNYNTVISSIGALPSMVLGRGNYGLLQIIGIPDQGSYYQQMCLASFQNNTSSFSAGGTLPSMSPAVPFSGVGIGGGYNGLVVVGVGASDSHLYVADFQDANNKGAWSAGSEIPGPGTGGAQTAAIASPVVASGAGGLQVGGLGTDGQLHMVAWQSSSNGSWTAFGSIPTYANSNTYSQIVTAPTSGPSLDIIGLDSQSNVVLITYQSSGGTWTQGALLTGP